MDAVLSLPHQLITETERGTASVKLERYSENPVVSPDPDSPWESGATFNPWAILADDGRVYLLYRAIADGYTAFTDRPGYDNYVSTVGCAVSEDGKRFVRRSEPAAGSYPCQ